MALALTIVMAPFTGQRAVRLNSRRFTVLMATVWMPDWQTIALKPAIEANVEMILPDWRGILKRRATSLCPSETPHQRSRLMNFSAKPS